MVGDDDPADASGDEMACFNGKYFHSVDHKGRISLPARFRRNGKSRKYMLLRGMERCLLLFTMPEWDRMIAEQYTSPFIESRVLRKHQRYIGANSCEASLDKQGRITIPGHMLEFAGIGKEALVVGAINWIEIWNPEEYQCFEDNHPYEENAEEVFDTLNRIRQGRK